MDVKDKDGKLLNPIVDIKVVRAGESYEGYTRINVSLNHGVTGPAIYLCYRRADDSEFQNPDTKYITALAGYYSTTYAKPANWFNHNSSYSKQLNDGVKAISGDNYANIMFQYGPRIMENLQSDGDLTSADPILAASLDIPQDKGSADTGVYDTLPIPVLLIGISGVILFIKKRKSNRISS